MIITLVTDQFYETGHGVASSAQRIYNGLVAHGHTVRILSVDENGQAEFGLKIRSFGKPIDKVFRSQGFVPAKPDKEVIKEAIKGADVVHIFLPFKLGYTTLEICREENVPCTAAFHLVPENMTSTVYMNKAKTLNNSIWRLWNKTTYRYVQHIHCPSLMVAKQMEKHNYHADLHVISNGYNSAFVPCKESKPKIFEDKFIIAFVGRFSREKRYDLIIKAVEQSKHKDKIQLIFGGRGPTKKHIMKMAKKLPNYPVFSFFNREQLVSLLNFADLYIHPADIEVEGMSCIEAIACGCVPLVSDSPQSATPQFTLRKESRFKHGDAKDLAAKIDWWFEHQDQIPAEKERIAKHAEKFQVEKSITFYEQMFKDAIADWDKDYDGLKKKKARPCKIVNNYEMPKTKKPAKTETPKK